jgi:MFS family permease
LARQSENVIHGLPQRAPAIQSLNRALPPGRAAATAGFPLAEKATLARPLPCTDPPAGEKYQSSSFAPIASPTPGQSAKRSTASWRPIAFIFLPFAAGYYLSYLFRTINALIAGSLTSELGLGAGRLGLLTSVYFLTFAAAQIPIGILLDRYGPRRVQSAFLLIAAAGAALFGACATFVPLVIARAMIGLGVAASLTAGLKAVILWFPKERVALVNGWMIMCGALGAVTATAPAERLLDWIGWRGLFEFLAATTALAAAFIYFVVPEPLTLRGNASSQAGLTTIYADRRFWTLAPLSATCVGSAWALQGLWAGPWFIDVERLDRPNLIMHLFIMAVAVSLGALLLGIMADRIRRRGLRTAGLLAVVAAISIVAQFALIVRLPLPAIVPWSAVAIVGAGTVLSYAILADYFPKEVAGRANAALNVFHLGWAFIVQYGIGLVLAQWPREQGHYPVIAYQVAFALNVAAQIAALLWFARPTARTLGSALRVNFRH